MNSIEFNKSIRDLNIAYREIFDYIPSIQNFSCTREEYTQALKKAIEEKKEISEYLPAVVNPNNPNAII